MRWKWSNMHDHGQLGHLQTDFSSTALAFKKRNFGNEIFPWLASSLGLDT